jgi:hypothetical protein
MACPQGQLSNRKEFRTEIRIHVGGLGTEIPPQFTFPKAGKKSQRFIRDLWLAIPRVAARNFVHVYQIGLSPGGCPATKSPSAETRARS